MSVDGVNEVLTHFEIKGTPKKQEYLKKVLIKVLDTDLGLALAREIISKTNTKIQIQNYTKKDSCFHLSDETLSPGIINLRKLPIYIIQGIGDKTAFTRDVLSPEAVLFHELVHQWQFLTLKDYQRISASPPNNPEYDNKIEELAITEGPFSEHAFCLANHLPLRFNHTGSYYPPATDMLAKNYRDRQEAFLDYLIEGAQTDMIIIAKTFTDKEIIDCLRGLVPELSPGSEDYHDFLSALKYLIRNRNLPYEEVLEFFTSNNNLPYEELESLIKDMKFDINTPSMDGTICFIKYPPQTLAQLKKLEDLGADFSIQDRIGENLLFKYFEKMQRSSSEEERGEIEKIIEYLIKEKKFDINKPNISGEICFIKYLPKTLLELKKLEDFGADYSIEDSHGNNLLFAFFPQISLPIPNTTERRNEIDKIIEYLIKEKKLDINKQNAKGEICFINYPPRTFAQLKKLEDLGANFSIQDSLKRSCIKRVSELVQREKDKAILKDLLIKDTQEDELFFKYCKAMRDGLTERGIKLEVIFDDLIKEKKFDINRPNAKGEICFINYPPRTFDQLKKLEDLGADFSIQDSYGTNLLFKYFEEMRYALAKEKLEIEKIKIIEYLIKEKKFDINLLNAKGEICFLENPPINLAQLKKLEDLGANFSLKNKSGRDLLSEISRTYSFTESIQDDEYLEMVRYLVQEKKVKILPDKYGKYFWEQFDKPSTLAKLYQENLIPTQTTNYRAKVIHVVALAILEAVVWCTP